MPVAFDQHDPSPDLSWFVQYHWTLSGHASAADLHPIFPDGSPELVFNLGAIVNEVVHTETLLCDATHDVSVDRSPPARLVQPRAMLVGQMARPVCIEPTGVLDMMGVRLSPFGVAALFQVPASELRDRTTALLALDVAGLCALPDALRNTQDTPARLCLVENALRHCMRRSIERLSHAGERQLHSLAHSLRRAPAASVDRWSRALRCSARTLERHFDRYVGLSPKEYARIRRFQQALGLATGHPSLKWSAIAAQTGYADQSHLVRDFRQYAGAAPSVVRPAFTEISESFVDNTALPQ